MLISNEEKRKLKEDLRETKRNLYRLGQQFLYSAKVDHNYIYTSDSPTAKFTRYHEYVEQQLNELRTDINLIMDFLSVKKVIKPATTKLELVAREEPY